jgi:predicted ATP-grasp superfamily ATP-dependent carboligase/CelD/BcsL family acetyltransferase involved in cellulose biosynthesis
LTRGRVIVTDAQERAVLAAIRCLHDQGFDVTALAKPGTAPGLWSRMPVGRHEAPDPRVSVEGFISSVEAIAREREYDALLPGTDDALLVLSQNRGRLQPHLELGLPEHRFVDRALDKMCLITESAEVGLDAPEARLCATVAEARAAAAGLGYPVIVKPLHTVLSSDGATTRLASRLAWTPGTLAEAAVATGTCIVQRRLRGSVISFGGVMSAEGLLAAAVSRYLRTWPPDAGNVSFSETIVPPAGLCERVEALVERIGWTGMFELELIDDDGRMSAIDFNPRPYGSLALAVGAGAPLPAVWCDWLLHRGRNVASARAGVRYRWEDADFRHLAFQVRRRDARAALAVATPHRHVAHAYFQLRDPGPAVARGIELAALTRRRRTQRRGGAGPSFRIAGGLAEARDTWTSLAERSRNIFSTWEWADVWWRHFGAGRELTVAVVEAAAEPLAILPVHTGRRPGSHVARFVGHGVADQLGPVCAAVDAQRAVGVLPAALGPRTVVLAERLASGPDWARALGGRVIFEESSPTIDLSGEGSWECYLAARSANFRQQVRRRARNLERGHGVRFRLADDPDRLGADLDSLLRLHAARWGIDSIAFRGPREAFHREFAALALERGWLRLWLAEVGRVPVAAWYGFRFAGVESYYQGGRDPSWTGPSLGTGILEHSIREAFADGLDEYRLLRGGEAYKFRYATADAPVVTVAAGEGSLGKTATAVLELLAKSASGRRVLRFESPD